MCTELQRPTQITVIKDAANERRQKNATRETLVAKKWQKKGCSLRGNLTALNSTSSLLLPVTSRLIKTVKSVVDFFLYVH